VSRTLCFASALLAVFTGCAEQAGRQSPSRRPVDLERDPAPRAAPSPVRVIEGIRFVEAPAGTATLGSPEDEPGRDEEEWQRPVTFGEPFWIAQTETTQAAYERLLGVNPSPTKGAGLPVTCVTYDEAAAFVEALNGRSQEYRFALPSEEQWEYAHRAGSASAFAPAGVPDEFPQALRRHQEGDPDVLLRLVRRTSWFNESGPQPVGKLKPNAWGLHDMAGNVAEWCDAHHPADEDQKLLRGGAWSSPSVWCCRCARRGWERRDVRKESIGFRVVAIPRGR
jgi:formylglycine-generating enzyme required for sulfatase activity